VERERGVLNRLGESYPHKKIETYKKKRGPHQRSLSVPG
jgi:hypothetical protein